MPIYVISVITIMIEMIQKFMTCTGEDLQTISCQIYNNNKYYNQEEYMGGVYGRG